MIEILDYKGRIRKLTNSLRNSAIDVVALTTLPNLRYFFNYSGISFERFCCALISLSTLKTAIVLPKLDEEKARDSPVDQVHPWTDTEGFTCALKKAVSEIGGKNQKLGCEDGITFGQMEALRMNLGSSKFQSVSAKIGKIRLRKEAEETESLRQISGILAKGYKAAREGILRAGITENQAGFEIRKALFDLGASEVDFCAVQSGSNGAIPHLETTKKTIEKGDAIVVDISCTNEQGYFADFTRTFVVGKPSGRLVEVHRLVKKAQAAGVRSAKLGVSAQDVDSSTRAIIVRGGMGQYFFHRTGHGIGLEVHEPPWIRQGNKMKLAEGMVFTVEPGVYLSGEFGVRIEDNIIIGGSGPENLTKLTHNLIEL